MKQFVPIVLSLMGSVTFGSLAAGADPVVYISNQTGFAKPIIYGWGFGVPGDYSTYFDLGSSGLTPQGTKTVDGITYDKFEVPADAVGKTVSLQYYDNWSYQKPDYEITFEDKEYYLLANAAGLKEVTAGGVNRYVQLYLENQTDFTQDKNKFTVYATSAGGTELLGAYPGVSYDAVRRVEGVDYYIWDMPYGTTPYTFTFSNEPNGYKLEDGPVITPDKDTFVRITNSSYTVLPDPRSASVTISNIVYTIDKTASTARVDGMADPAEAIASLVIPATVAYDGKDYAVTSIADGAFNGCTNLSGTLSLGENLVTIGKNAFSGCQNLSGSVVIGDKVTSIGESAFSSCIGFDGTLTLGASVAAIGKNSFLMCSGLTGALTIPESVTSVGAGAFSGCYGFDGALTIGGAVTSIGAQAFMGCRNLTGALTLPESVTSLGESSFMSCSGFNGALILPSGLTKIEDNIFFGCDNLTGSLTIPAGVTAIGRAAFSGCKKLSGTLTIPAAVTTVGDNAFFDCSGFNGSLELGGNITSIGSGAFMNCSGMWGWLTLP